MASTQLQAYSVRGRFVYAPSERLATTCFPDVVMQNGFAIVLPASVKVFEEYQQAIRATIAPHRTGFLCLVNVRTDSPQTCDSIYWEQAKSLVKAPSCIKSGMIQLGYTWLKVLTWDVHPTKEQKDILTEWFSV